MNLKKVAVAVPIYKPELSGEEQLSLGHLLRFLGGYDIFYVAPDGLEFNYHKFPVIYFDKKYFKSLDTYSKLLLTRKFYGAFKDYEYILLYQLDCLVFSDQLLQWCQKGYDYIGAPWLAGRPGYATEEDKVGNGGFSLRRVSAMMEVLKAKEGLAGQLKNLSQAIISKPKGSAAAYWKAVRAAWRRTMFSKFVVTEDYFWSFDAVKYKPDFNIAPVKVAFNFSFEVDPQDCFERNNHQLPFGCHAWAKWDRKFWEPYLLKD